MLFKRLVFFALVSITLADTELPDVAQTDIAPVLNAPFLMSIEGVFTMPGRGIVATGRIERGIVQYGDELEIVGLSIGIMRTVCTGIEMFHKSLPRGEAGNNVGILLRGIKHEQVKRGQVLATPGSIKAYREFVTTMDML
ncbi:translation elongation factor Tu, partial [Podila clonocystis]